MTWKPQKPLTAKLLPLGGKEGYNVMIEAMEERKNQRVVTVWIPPPAGPMEAVNVHLHNHLFCW